MLARCLLVCFALTLAGADPVPPQDVISCSNIKPLTKLNIEQIRGDWIEMATSSFYTNGRLQELPPRGSPAYKSFSSACVHMRFDTNSTQDHVTGTLVGHFGGGNTTERFEYLVSAEEKGRLVSVHDTDNEILVTSSEAGKFLVLVECQSLGEVKSPLAVMILSRYQHVNGTTVVTQQELENVVLTVRDTLGLSEYQPLILDTSCYEHHIVVDNETH